MLTIKKISEIRFFEKHTYAQRPIMTLTFDAALDYPEFVFVKLLRSPGIDSQPICRTEPVFVNVYGAQELILMDRFRKPMHTGGPVRQLGLSYRPAMRGIDSWAP